MWSIIKRKYYYKKVIVFYRNFEFYCLNSSEWKNEAHVICKYNLKLKFDRKYVIKRITIVHNLTKIFLIEYTVLFRFPSPERILFDLIQ